MKKWLVFAIILIASVVLFRPTESCNKAICASVVSKCMLTQSCKCDLKDCSCCKECFSCLSYLYSECCSCVDMCPKPNETNNVLSKKSHIEDFHDSIPGLFKALTSDPDPLQRWLTFTFPVDFDQSPYRIQHEKEEYYLQSVDSDVTEPKSRDNIITVNCTVAYQSQCMSWNKCKHHCQTMGSSSYRWFHDGCCECIGDTCINYGINESRCLECPEPKEGAAELDDTYDAYDDELDYGEGVGPLDAAIESNA